MTEGFVQETTTTTRRAADRIRETARDLFYRRGIRAVGVEEIVDRAGVTKPSLYRAFSSKDELAVSYLADYDREYWTRFEDAAAAHPGDPRAQLRMVFSRLAEKAVSSGYRGCGMTNAVIEYPEGHPACTVSRANKQELRQRLAALARDMRARDPKRLGDGLLLLMEGSYVSGQLFGPGGPAGSLVDVAFLLIDAACEA